jgi:DNA repair exonuclease SbcCD ATPase subunit
MIQLKTLKIRNFLSIGAIDQIVDFSNNDLILILGENLDLGGADNKNGTGKTSLVQAVTYALYGKPLVSIKKDNLINKINLKNMFVSLTFETGGIEYRIERGRKPNIFKFIKNGIEKENCGDIDESQGEGRNTQNEIEKLLGLTYEVYRHIIALNTYVEPFLSMSVGNQRTIIEQLLGITKLSEKAEKLKELSTITKDEIRNETFRINATKEANKRIEQNIAQIELKSGEWEVTHKKNLDKLQKSITEFTSVDIDSEIELHTTKKEIQELNNEYRSLTREYSNLTTDVAALKLSHNKLTKILSKSVENICPTCNQEMDKDTHEKVHDEYLTQHKDLEEKIKAKNIKLDELKILVDSVKAGIPEVPVTFYSSISEAYTHKTTVDTLCNSLERELANNNPFIDQIRDLRKNSIQEIKFDTMNDLDLLQKHQLYLLKLLTNKDSFIRTKIIEQNLTFLNHRLSHYLTKIGLPHLIKFKSDLEVDISLNGREYDFDNLSRGEKTRLILSLSFAFRDVFENMNEKFNILILDEILDSGMDSNGVDNAITILKEMSRTNGRAIYAISHREECVARIPNILKVTKEHGFTTFIKEF